MLLCHSNPREVHHPAKQGGVSILTMILYIDSPNHIPLYKHSHSENSNSDPYAKRISSAPEWSLNVQSMHHFLSENSDSRIAYNKRKKP
jgi:hypothetical protein